MSGVGERLKISDMDHKTKFTMLFNKSRIFVLKNENTYDGKRRCWHIITMTTGKILKTFTRKKN